MNRVVAVVLILTFSAPAWGRPACTGETEKDAMAVRVLQSEFMVAAVACNQASAYNSFVRKFQTFLTSQGLALKGYFARIDGPHSERGLNDFLTEIANGWAIVHMKDKNAYCKNAWDRMWIATNQSTPKADLIAQARERALVPSVSGSLCPGVGKAKSATSKPYSNKAK